VNQYRRLVDRGLDEFERTLAESLGRDEVAEIRRLVGDLNFPGMIGLLATSDTGATPDADRELDDAAAAVADELSHRNVSADDVRSLLTDTLLRRSPPDDVEGADLRDAALESAVTKLAADAGLAVTPAQAREAAKLLATGEFFRDVGDATAAVLFQVRGLPLALRRDLRGPRRIGRVALAIVRDAGASLFDIPAIVADLRDGQLDAPPVVLAHTLGALFDFASLRSTAEMVQVLLQPENESVRLAITVYARANGVPIEAADLDAVRETLFDPEQPDLGPALVRALRRLSADRSVREIQAMLTRMSRNPDG
jgi:hypothetical protein